MEYRTKKSYASWIGLFMGGLIFSFCIWGIGYSLGRPEDLTLKVMLYIPVILVLVGFIFFLIGSFNQAYSIEEKQLVIHWGLTSMKVPWEEINEVKEIKGESNLYAIFGARWAGYIAGLYQVKGLGPVRMFGTRHHEGFVYVKSGKGFFGLTPEDPNFINEIARKAGKEIEVVNMDEISEEVKGKSPIKDSFYKLLLRLNIGFLLCYAVYLGIFFPWSSADSMYKIIILLLVLAVCLFFFTLGNANRLYHFSPNGGYFLLVLGIMVTGIFIIISVAEISLK
ncbi:MAG: PH domain-containing protein [Syntrophomonas sp.]